MKEKQPRKPSFYINIALFAVFIAAIVYLTVRFAPAITDMVKDPEKLRGTLLSYGHWSILIFMLLQALQVVIAVIPGEVVQIAGGYVFGTFLGTVYSVAGILVGMLVAFFAARLFGYAFVKQVVPEKSFKKLDFLINGEKSEVALFLLFLIPGIPKDTLTYIAGVTPVKPLRFLVIASVGRLPGLIGSSVIGANLQSGNMWVVILVFAAALILFVAGLIFRDKVLKKIQGMKKK